MSHPIITQQITFLYTNNLAESTHFYEEILGLKLWLDQGSCRIYQVSANSCIGICQVSETAKGKISAGEQNNVVFTLVTPQVDEWYTHLQLHGIKFEKAPEHNPYYHIYHCFLRDPNGYLIEIQHFLNQDENSLDRGSNH